MSDNNFNSYVNNQCICDWKNNAVLETFETNNSKTAVLIIAPPILGDCKVSNKWKIGRKVWEQYMNSNPNVDCYFLQIAEPRLDKDENNQVWLEGNTIFVGDVWYKTNKSDRILHKTVSAIEWLLPHYTHFVRTNINTFFNLKKLELYNSTHGQSYFTTPTWEGAWYTIGYGIMFTSDVAKHIASEYRRLEAEGIELISPNHADDAIITSLATGVWPYDEIHPFRCSSSLPYGIRQLMSFDTFEREYVNTYGTLIVDPINFPTALMLCECFPDTNIIHRLRADLDLVEYGQLYDVLLNKTYPELSVEKIKDYASKLVKNSNCN